MLLLVTVLFSLALLILNQLWSPPLRLQVSNCSTYVPSVAVFCSEYIERFPVMAWIFFFKPLIPLRWLQLLPRIVGLHNILCISK
jgi:hypothetical protein